MGDGTLDEKELIGYHESLRDEAGSYFAENCPPHVLAAYGPGYRSGQYTLRGLLEVQEIRDLVDDSISFSRTNALSLSERPDLIRIGVLAKGLSLTPYAIPPEDRYPRHAKILTGRPIVWTSELDAELTELCSDGSIRTWKEISVLLGLAPTAAENRANELGITKPNSIMDIDNRDARFREMCASTTLTLDQMAEELGLFAHTKKPRQLLSSYARDNEIRIPDLRSRTARIARLRESPWFDMDRLENLRDLIASGRFSQREMGDILGVTQTAIALVRNRHLRRPDDTLKSAAEVSEYVREVQALISEQ